jgi:tetratricopeptide (TPR) repeat protein
MPADSTVSPEQRKRLQQLFAKGNEQMSRANYEYADDIYFTPCVLQDPGNPIYARAFLANLRKKFGEKKKTTGSLLATGKKMVADSKKPEILFRVSIETLKTNPWDISSLISTGEACDTLGFHETALIYFESAVDADSNHIGANIAYCAALREAADFDGAISCIKRIIKQRPEDREVQKLLKDILAEKTIHQGKYATGVSREVLEAAVSVVPENEDAMGRILTVEEQIERRITRNPQDTANYVELAQHYLKQSDFAKAEESYARAADVSENTPAIVEGLLETQKKRLHAESLRLKEEYENNLQEESKAIFLATRNQYEAKKMELAQYRVKHYPNHMGYRYDYGMVLQKNEQVNEAIVEFQRAKADKNRAGDCLLALGQCFQMIRQYKLAMTHYQEAVSVLEPGENKKKALYLAMKLAFTLENYDLAEEYGHQLAAIDFAYRDLGEILDQITQRQKAKPQS